MGAYTWLSEGEFERFSKIEYDQELDEILQEARSLDPNIYVGTYYFIEKSFWGLGKIIKHTRFSLYSRCNSDNDEVRVLNLKTENRDYIANYLFGLINGYRACIVNSVNKS